MNNNNEQKFNTIAYVIFVITGLIYLYITIKEKELSKEDYDRLLHIARSLAFVTAAYFFISAIIGINEDNSNNQYKQVIASLLVAIAAITRLSITNDDILFR